jgi:sugar/nucleoside kinase (ribokinase family)
MTQPHPAARDLDLLVAGEINPDVIVTDPDPRPVFGQHERFVAGIRIAPGSSSVITACGAARLGLRVSMAGVVGDDALGRFMLETMRERGLDVSACRVDPVLPTGASVILGNGTDRAILTSRGTIGELRATDVPHALLARTRHLHVGSWFLQGPARPELAALLRAARQSGLTTSVDPNWDPAGEWDGGFAAVAATVDLVLPNAAEACLLAGLEDPEAAALALADPGTGTGAGGPTVVVKLGAAGALAATPDGTVVHATAPRVDPVDTTGAGDSFNAGFLAAWLEGQPLEACLRFAVACGSLSTLAPGGTDAQPTRAQVEAVLVGGAA